MCNLVNYVSACRHQEYIQSNKGEWGQISRPEADNRASADAAQRHSGQLWHVDRCLRGDPLDFIAAVGIEANLENATFFDHIKVLLQIVVDGDDYAEDLALSDVDLEIIAGGYPVKVSEALQAGDHITRAVDRVRTTRYVPCQQSDQNELDLPRA